MAADHFLEKTGNEIRKSNKTEERAALEARWEKIDAYKRSIEQQIILIIENEKITVSADSSDNAVPVGA